MRYVFGNRSLLAGVLLSLAGCMGQAPPEHGQPSYLLINEQGCRQDAADYARQYFQSAVVYATAATPENSPQIGLEKPISFNLLDPRSVAAVLEALPRGTYSRLFLEISSAAIVLAASPGRITGLYIPGNRFEVLIAGELTIDHDDATIEIASACVDGLKVVGNDAFADPARLSVNHFTVK